MRRGNFLIMRASEIRAKRIRVNQEWCIDFFSVGQSNFRNKIPNFIEQKNFAHFQGKDNKNNPWYLSCCYALDKKAKYNFLSKSL